MAFLDSIIATNPPDSEDIRLGASRIRALADAAKDTVGAEHNEDDGTHKIPIQTDGSDPSGVRDYRFWFNSESGAYDVRFREGGTTRIVTGLPAAGGSGGGGAGHATRAYLDADQSISTGAVTKLAFNAENWDLDGEFDSTTGDKGRFTPTVAGLYLVNAGVQWEVATGSYRSIRVRKNGSDYSAGTQIDGPDTGSQSSPAMETSAIVDMNGTTDYLEIFVQQGTGSTLKARGDAAADESFVEIVKLTN